MLTEMF